MIDLEARVDATIETHANCENCHSKDTITAREGSYHQTNRRTILSDTVDDFSGCCEGEAIG